MFMIALIMAVTYFVIIYINNSNVDRSMEDNNGSNSNNNSSNLPPTPKEYELLRVSFRGK
jgi:hypothetical protein